MELKPCPFCGSAAELDSLTAIRKAKKTEVFRVECGRCHIRDNYWHTSCRAAARAWNTRAERTGRIKEHETGHLVCSECGAVQTEWTVYYCWNCGAKLETVGARRSRYSVDERIWVDADGYRVIISDCAVVEHE